MSFAAPWWLAVLTLAPLIVALHLRRRAVHPVATTWLWRSVADGFEPAPRWKRPPSTRALWLQLAALALAAVSLADPRIGAAAGTEGPVVVVIDAGIAMDVRDGADGTTRFDAATSMVLDAVAARPERSWSVWSAGPRPRPLALEQHDHGTVARLLEGARASHDAPDWFALARALDDDLDATTTVVVLSASPDPGEGPLHAAAERRGAELEWVSFAAQFDNLGVERVDARHERPVGRWIVDATVRADGTVPARGEAPELVASFRPDGTATGLEVARSPLAFSLGGQARASFELALPGAGVLTLAIAGSDAFAADDSFVLRIDPEPGRPRLAVITADASSSPTVRALLALDGHDVIALRPDEPIPAAIALLVVDGVSDPFAVGAPLLGTPPPAVLWLGTGPGVVDAAALATMDPAVGDWRADHPLSRGTSWGAVELERALQLTHPSGAEVVVAGLTAPLVSVRSAAGQRDVVVSLDPSDPSWTMSPLFPTFLADAVSWLAPPSTTSWACTTGSPCLHPDGTVAATVEHPIDGALLSLPSPGDGIVPSSLDRWFVPARAGLWHRDDSTPIPVNVGASAALALRAAASVSANEPTLSATLTASDGGTPWLRWSVVALLLLVLAEAVIAGRGDERFARSTALRGGSRVARRHRRVLVLTVLASAGLTVAAIGGPWPRWLDTRVLVILSDAPDDAAQPAGGAGVATRTVPVTVTDGFDLAAVLERALASSDPDADVRVRVDVAAPATRGDVVASLPALSERGVSVDVRPPVGLPSGDVVVRRVSLDRAPRAGDTATLQAVVVAERSSDARLLVERDGVLEVDTAVTLSTGTSVVRAPMRFDESGRISLVVRIEAPDDPRPQNDAAGLLVDVGEPPVVHVFSADSARGERLVEALSLQGLDATLRPPHAAPVRPEGYAGIDAVVLSNVAALEFTTLQQEVLEAYVRDSGGGLVIAGGERAFGPGGYHQTTLDRLSPLAAQIPRDAPEVAMLFVLDRSGSMQQLVGSVTRLDIAKEATLAAVELLGEQSQVAIVVFDEEANVLLPFVASDDRQAIEAALAPLVPGGGTAIYPGLVLAAELLDGLDAATRHVIVMTDGLSQPGDYPSAVNALRDLDATVSAVAIGAGADIETIQLLASLGGGMAHVTTDFQALPGILAQEAMMLAGDPIVAETVVPRRTPLDSDVMLGVPERLPPLTSFVETSAKAAADVLLEDDEGRPLLASWRYGSGRVIAFGAQAIGPWVDAWTALEAFPRWWGQWVRWTSQPMVGAGLTGVVHVVGDEAWLQVDAAASDATTVRTRRLEAEARPLDTALASRHQGIPVRGHLVETAAGRFEGRLPLTAGRWELVVTDLDDDTVSLVIPVDHAYAARYGVSASHAADLRFVAAATGGRVLLGGEPAHPEDARRRWVVEVAAWRPWLAAAIAVWLVSLIVRYAPGWTERPAAWLRSAAALLRSRRASASPGRAG